MAHADPDLDEIARAYDARYPLDPDAPAGSAAVIRTGEPELVEEIPESFFATVTGDEEQLRILRGMGFRSYVIVPLIARGRVIGDLALAHSLSGRRYGRDDLEMLRALADACAMAIDNARLFGEQQATARTLQQSLLPRELPAVDGLELAARYRPYGGIEVGGDFYDVFPVPGGWTLAIGDVAGKGTAAAATTALLRHTLRVAAHLERSPAAALARMDEALLREDDVEHPASAVCGLLRVLPGGAAEIVLAAAGHPPPYVRRRDGRVEDTVRPGALLGALPGPVPSETTVVLQPGDVLVLYTDGVTEARGPRGEQLGEAGLAAALAHAEPTASGVAAAIEHRAVEFSDGRPSDDIAVLAIGVPSP